MKKTAFILLLIAAATRLNAQQVKTVPDIKLNDGLQNTFKPNDWQSPQTLLLQPVVKPSSNLNAIIVYSTMPVAKVASTDRMPVVVPGDPNVKYTMMVKKVEIVDPTKQVNNTEQPAP